MRQIENMEKVKMMDKEKAKEYLAGYLVGVMSEIRDMNENFKVSLHGSDKKIEVTVVFE